MISTRIRQRGCRVTGVQRIFKTDTGMGCRAVICVGWQEQPEMQVMFALPTLALVRWTNPAVQHMQG
jgi:DNA polymerase II small subunit/DNA polymerase delta subunit B